MLAVGDAAFQKKHVLSPSSLRVNSAEGCLGKMGDVAREGLYTGRTLCRLYRIGAFHHANVPTMTCIT